MSNNTITEIDVTKEVSRLDLTFDDAIEKAKDAITLQEKVNFIIDAAIDIACSQGNNGDMRTKFEPFYAALVRGTSIAGLNGLWYALATHDVAGWNMWGMKTPMLNKGIINGSDGCRYYAAYCGS